MPGGRLGAGGGKRGEHVGEKLGKKLGSEENLEKRLGKTEETHRKSKEHLWKKIVEKPGTCEKKPSRKSWKHLGKTWKDLKLLGKFG